MNIQMLACTVAYAFSSSAIAKGPSWGFVDVGFQHIQDERALYDDKIDISGYSLTLSKEFSHEFFTQLEFDYFDDNVELSSGDFDNVKSHDIGFGLGYNHRVTKHTDIYGVVAFEMTDWETSFGSGDDTGNSIKVGARTKVTEWLELSAEIERKDMSDKAQEDNTLQLGSRLMFGEMFSLGLYAKVGEDTQAAMATLRLSF